MEIRAKLKELFDEDKATKLGDYLDIKHKGGKNNSKGNNLENFYAIYQIAKAFNRNFDKQKTLFSSQRLAFIDDLVIEKIDANRSLHFQIKDVKDLNWENGSSYSIAEDFEFQNKLNNYSDLAIVVSEERVANKLKETIPNEIKEFVAVIHFSSETSISKLIFKNEDFKSELVKICAINNPAHNTLEAVATILLGVWDASNKSRISLKQILDNCYNQNPHYIKGFDGRLSKELEAVFISVKGFTYKIDNGFVTWKYGETDFGTLSFPIGSKGYLEFENSIMNLDMPISFEQLEPYLF